MAIPDPFENDIDGEGMDGDWENLEEEVDPYEYYLRHGIYHFQNTDQMGGAWRRLFNEFSSFNEGIQEYIEREETERIPVVKFQLLESVN